MKKHKIAAIDVGSNSIKLAIIETAEIGEQSRSSFKILFQERDRVRLGQETLSKKILSPAAIARAVESIASFRAIAENQGAETIIAAATACVREAANSKEFVQEVEKKTGVRVEVLSSVEEARLIGLAAVESFALHHGKLLNIDIGGGSTELSLMHNGAPEKLFSMEIGAVRLTENFIFSNPVTEKELQAVRNEIGKALELPRRELKNSDWQITGGTSGTILTLAGLMNFQADRKFEIQFQRLTGLNKIITEISTEQRSQMPNISPQRAEVIVAGGQILEIIMRELEIETLRPTTFALREGLILDHLRKTAIAS